jgi:hypothetical protein
MKVLSLKRFILILIVFSRLDFYAQKISNYVNNGSFEEYLVCSVTAKLDLARHWTGIDSTSSPGLYSSECPQIGTVPYGPFGFQYPKSGKAFVLATFFCEPTTCGVNSQRSYIRNRLKAKLISGKTYCVKYYVNATNESVYAIDATGAFFADAAMDTITKTSVPLTYITPQIQNPTNNIIMDTLSWVLVSGTFVANGTEKYLIIGNFKSNSATNKAYKNSSYSNTIVAADHCIDDVSCVEADLPAYAGPDRSIKPGDSTYIGRENDFAIDPGCTWYKLPNMTTSIDTVSGMWVKPTVTSTYVVRQELDCSTTKWDTVIIYMNYVGIDENRLFNDRLETLPNPVSESLYLSYDVSYHEQTVSITIINSLGQVIRKEEVLLKESRTGINIKDLPNGVYTLLLSKDQAGTITRKVVVSN